MTDIVEWPIKQVGRRIPKTLREDKDLAICLSGLEGSGKSTASEQILEAANEKKFNVSFNTLFYPTIEEIEERYNSKSRYLTFSWDEAIRILYKLEWASKTAKVINKDFAVNRALNIGTILLLPRFRDLNEFFRNHRVALWGHVIERGVIMWYSRDWNQFAPDPWHWDENYRIIRKKQGIKPLSKFRIEDIIRIGSRAIGFEAITYFDKYPKNSPIWMEYLSLKESKRSTMITEYAKTDKFREDRKSTRLNSSHTT
jgi:hypothetical protein